ncbi:extracellular solute-binding protein [Paenibacillus contaminans]|nr:extracellular solute-binding protein [Paenibacillus contaminans]
MNRKLASWGAAALAGALAASALTGCAGKSANTPAAESAAPNSPAGDKENKEKLPITIMTQSWAGGGWPDDYSVIKKLNEKLNIDLKIQWVPADNYTEKLNVLAASNSFPDAFYLGGDLFSKWRDKGIFLDIKDELPNYPNLTKHLSESTYKVLNPKDKIFGIPHYGIEARDPLMIRKDWLDKLGLKVPDTLDEFYEVAKAFVNGDPDGNGQKDTIGITFGMTKTGSLFNIEHVMGAFGLIAWKDANGSLVPLQAQTQEWKDFLTFMQKAYKEGVLDKDFAVNKSRDPWSKFEAGKTGITIANPFEFYTDSVPLIKKTSPNAEFVQLNPPAGPTGLRGGITSSLSTAKIVLNAKTDKAKQKRIMELFDYMLSDEGFDLIKHGIEGVHYKKNGDKFEKLEAFDKDRPYLISTWLIRRNDPLIQVRKWDDPTYTKTIQSIFEINEKFKRPNPATGLVSDTNTKIGPELSTKFGETVTKIITGELPVGAIDKAIADWNSGGGDKIVKEMNEEYAKTK